MTIVVYIYMLPETIFLMIGRNIYILGLDIMMMRIRIDWRTTAGILCFGIFETPYKDSSSRNFQNNR